MLGTAECFHQGSDRDLYPIIGKRQRKNYGQHKEGDRDRDLARRENRWLSQRKGSPSGPTNASIPIIAQRLFRTVRTGLPITIGGSCRALVPLSSTKTSHWIGTLYLRATIRPARSSWYVRLASARFIDRGRFAVGCCSRITPHDKRSSRAGTAQVVFRRGPRVIGALTPTFVAYWTPAEGNIPSAGVGRHSHTGDQKSDQQARRRRFSAVTSRTTRFWALTGGVGRAGCRRIGGRIRREIPCRPVVGDRPARIDSGKCPRPPNCGPPSRSSHRPAGPFTSRPAIFSSTNHSRSVAKHGVNLVGTGWGTRIIRRGDGDALQLVDASFCVIRNVLLLGDESAKSGSAIVCRGTCSSCTIDFCRIVNFAESGVRFEGDPTTSHVVEFHPELPLHRQLGRPVVELPQQ